MVAVVMSWRRWVRPAVMDDVPACKVIADEERTIFGFLPRGVFADAALHGRLLVAERADFSEATRAPVVVGFVRFNHHVRGTATTLYDIAVAPAARGTGAGRALVEALADSAHAAGRHMLVLRCPVDASANVFYERLGFRLQTVEAGRRRALNVWVRDTAASSS